MLNRVPTAIARAGRIVTLRHPNAMDCTVWRKRLLRTPDPAGAEMGGIPTIGGIGVLDGEDEAHYEYDPVGDAKIVFSGVWDGMNDGSNWNDADTGLIAPRPPITAMIELINEADGYVQKPDRITVEPGGGLVLAYEVLGESGSVNIPPYTRRYLLVQRSDAEVGVG